MKNVRIFLSENFHVLVVKFSVYLNRQVFVMLYHMSSFSEVVNADLRHRYVQQAASSN